MCILAEERAELKSKISDNWKIIYKCRNCGKLFQKSAELVKGVPVPTAPMVWTHKCDIGVYGYGDILKSITSCDEDWKDETETSDYTREEND